MLRYKIIAAKATGGLVQQGFCNSGAKLQSSTVVLRFNFCAKLKICASIAPPSQSPESLPAIITSIMRKTEKDIETIFDKNGISKYWSDFKDKIKPSIRIEYKFSNDAEIQIGKSKFGGLPDLPMTTNWAEYENKPLTFLAQINLEDLPNAEIQNLLPQSGLLSFFYSSENDDYASSPHRVIFSTINNNGFERKPQPENWNDDELIFNTGEVTEFKIEQSLPSGETEYVSEVFKNDTENKWKYWSLIEPDNSQETTNRMFGYPHNSDDRFELICECIADRDFELEQLNRFTEKQKNDIREKWVLLLQIDSNTDLEMYMGVDLDCFYFFIKKEDLAKRDFSKTVAFSVH